MADLTHPGILRTKNTGRRFGCFTAILTALASDAGGLRWSAEEKSEEVMKTTVLMRQ